MALRVNTNMDAISIQYNLINIQEKVAGSMKSLSSGRRIRSAKDDASGLAIANFFKAKISSMRVAYQNATESNNMLQVADGAYSNIHGILIRMKELAVQAAGGQIENANREQLNVEFMQLHAELDQIAESTKYGGQNLVYSTGTGNAASFTFQVDVTNDSFSKIGISLGAVSTGALAISVTSIGTASSASSAMGMLDLALGSVNDFMARVGAGQNRLQQTLQMLQVGIENFSSSESTIRDVDMAYEVTQFTKNQILQQTSMAMLAQANQAPQQILQLISG